MKCAVTCYPKSAEIAPSVLSRTSLRPNQHHNHNTLINTPHTPNITCYFYETAKRNGIFTCVQSSKKSKKFTVAILVTSRSKSSICTPRSDTCRPSYRRNNDASQHSPQLAICGKKCQRTLKITFEEPTKNSGKNMVAFLSKRKCRSSPHTPQTDACRPRNLNITPLLSRTS